MAFNLATFRQRVHSVARSNYFVVRIPQVGEQEVITALARGAELPAYEQEVQTVTYRGLEMKVAARQTYADWSVDFLCDEAHALRNIFISWMSKQYNAQNQIAVPHNEYKQDGLSVSQLSADGQITSTATFIGAFPQSVGPIALTHDGADILTFPVNFSIDQFFMNSTEGDFIDSDLDIDVGEDGRFSGVSVKGIAGVRLNLTEPA
jgi:hypothetical protein